MANYQKQLQKGCHFLETGYKKTAVNKKIRYIS